MEKWLRRPWGALPRDPTDPDLGRELIGEICGPVLLRMERFRPVLTEVLFIDVDPAHGPDEPLIGYIPLGQAQAAVDLMDHRLVKASLVDLN